MKDFKRFEVSHHGITYISEFDFEALKRADEMKIAEMTGSPINGTFSIFYCSVLKNHPYANQRKVREFFDEVIQDEDYGLTSFKEITDDFNEHFLALAAPSKKKFTAVAPASEIVNFPKAEQ